MPSPSQVLSLAILIFASSIHAKPDFRKSEDLPHRSPALLRNEPDVVNQADEGLWKVGSPVRTTSGLVIGHPATNVTGVSEYLGIPYAKAPVGDLRFAPPVAYRSNATFNASTFSPACPANTGAGVTNPALGAVLAGPNAVALLSELAQVGEQQSEDCLKINVWTKPQTGEKHKAVLLWIYGGGFATGSANNLAYIGKYFANDSDVVLVSFNYRENVFGFPGLPNVAGLAQNAGLLDQRLAVEWVRDNIAQFGGDPKRITLFGQSAGGGSVDYYTYAWTEDPIVNAFIPQSGTATSFTNPPPSNNTQAWYNASIILGCGDESTGIALTVACVRTKSYQSILNATVVTNPLQAVLGNFGPNVDGTVIFSDYDTRGAQGNFIKRPYLVGNVNYEAGLFQILALGQGITPAEWCLFDAAIFTCAAGKAAQYRAAQGVPTFRYRYYGEFPNIRLTLGPPLGPSGAWHGSEIPIIFGTAEDASGAPDTPAEVSIGNYLRNVWSTFAKNPDSALYGAPFFFPQYNQFTPSLIQFGQNNVTQPQFAFPITTDALCPLIAIVGALIPGGISGAFTGGASLPANISIPVTCSPTS